MRSRLAEPALARRRWRTQADLLVLHKISAVNKKAEDTKRYARSSLLAARVGNYGGR